PEEARDSPLQVLCGQVALGPPASRPDPLDISTDSTAIHKEKEAKRNPHYYVSLTPLFLTPQTADPFHSAHTKKVQGGREAG
ncbi:MAG: hypothetical protein L6R30_23885, partial [Thermoanaerobaculia bacterium]|nr:hypothetical protein [Thermoanaerobaculia bacterium]